MITFGLNKLEEQIAKASASVLKDKPVNHYNQFERIGISEGFIKSVGERMEGSINIGGLGYTVELNTKMANSTREVSILSADEIARGCKGGVAQTVFRVDSFADDERWLESLDINPEVVVAAFDIWDDLSFITKKKSLRSVLRIGLKGHPRSITMVSVLIEELSNSENLPMKPPNCSNLRSQSLNQRVNAFMIEHSLKSLIEMVLSNRDIGEALGLYDE